MGKEGAGEHLERKIVKWAEKNGLQCGATRLNYEKGYETFLKKSNLAVGRFIYSCERAHRATDNSKQVFRGRFEFGEAA